MVFLYLKIIPNIITTIEIISSIIIIWAFHSHGIFNFEPILKVGNVSRFRKSLFDNGHLHCVDRKGTIRGEQRQHCLCSEAGTSHLLFPALKLECALSVPWLVRPVSPAWVTNFPGSPPCRLLIVGLLSPWNQASQFFIVNPSMPLSQDRKEKMWISYWLWLSGEPWPTGMWLGRTNTALATDLFSLLNLFYLF